MLALVFVACFIGLAYSAYIQPGQLRLQDISTNLTRFKGSNQQWQASVGIRMRSVLSEQAPTVSGFR